MPVNQRQHYISVCINLYISDTRIEGKILTNVKIRINCSDLRFCNLRHTDTTLDVSCWYDNTLLICSLTSQPADNLRLCWAISLRMSVKQYAINCGTACVCADGLEDMRMY